jgi:putative adenylate-forming enzyme
VEKEYLDDRRFIPIITDFTRTSQPIIRYRLNDILVERKEPCPCGSCFTALERIEGREDDVFVFDGKNNEKVNVFPDFIRRLVLFIGEVSDYRIVQEENGDITVYWNENDAMKDKFMTELNKMAEDRNFIMPHVSFSTYSFDRSRKLKRVESRRKRS